MKRLAFTLTLLAAVAALFAQEPAAQIGLAQAQTASEAAGKKILFAYEESNEKLDPWLARFDGAFSAANIGVDKKPAVELSGTDVSKYDLIVVYASVMAFTAEEPVRDWLEKENRLAGKSVALFVTANRWFLKKYDNQLLGLLKKKDATVIDAVSGATKDLDDNAKQKMVRDFVERLER